MENTENMDTSSNSTTDSTSRPVFVGLVDTGGIKSIKERLPKYLGTYGSYKIGNREVLDASDVEEAKEQIRQWYDDPNEQKIQFVYNPFIDLDYSHGYIVIRDRRIREECLKLRFRSTHQFKLELWDRCQISIAEEKLNTSEGCTFHMGIRNFRKLYNKVYHPGLKNNHIGEREQFGELDKISGLTSSQLTLVSEICEESGWKLNHYGFCTTFRYIGPRDEMPYDEDATNIRILSLRLDRYPVKLFRLANIKFFDDLISKPSSLENSAPRTPSSESEIEFIDESYRNEEDEIESLESESNDVEFEEEIIDFERPSTSNNNYQRRSRFPSTSSDFVPPLPNSPLCQPPPPPPPDNYPTNFIPPEEILGWSNNEAPSPPVVDVDEPGSENGDPRRVHLCAPPPPKIRARNPSPPSNSVSANPERSPVSRVYRRRSERESSASDMDSNQIKRTRRNSTSTNSRSEHSHSPRPRKRSLSKSSGSDEGRSKRQPRSSSKQRFKKAFNIKSKIERSKSPNRPSKRRKSISPRRSRSPRRRSSPRSRSRDENGSQSSDDESDNDCYRVTDFGNARSIGYKFMQGVDFSASFKPLAGFLSLRHRLHPRIDIQFVNKVLKTLDREYGKKKKPLKSQPTKPAEIPSAVTQKKQDVDDELKTFKTITTNDKDKVSGSGKPQLIKHGNVLICKNRYKGTSASAVFKNQILQHISKNDDLNLSGLRDNKTETETAATSTSETTNSNVEQLNSQTQNNLKQIGISYNHEDTISQSSASSSSQMIVICQKCNNTQRSQTIVQKEEILIEKKDQEIQTNLPENEKTSLSITVPIPSFDIIPNPARKTFSIEELRELSDNITKRLETRKKLAAELAEIEKRKNDKGSEGNSTQDE